MIYYTIPDYTRYCTTLYFTTGYYIRLYDTYIPNYALYYPKIKYTMYLVLFWRLVHFCSLFAL